MTSLSAAHLALFAAAWLLTYLLHSTALLGAVWLLVSRVRRIPLRWQDRAWKLALVGGLVTASVQVGLGIEPFGGRVVLSPPEEAAPRAADAEPADLGRIAGLGSDAAPAASGADAAPARPKSRPATSAGEPANAPFGARLPAEDAPLALRVTAASTPPSSAGADAPPPPAGPLAARIASRPWMAAIWALWLAGAAVGLFAFARALRRLRAHLAGRVALDDGPLRERLDALMARAGFRGSVRLTASPHVAAPLTHGMLRREICVPVRALHELTPTQQEAMLGHELGHAIRRDPTWLGFCWMLERVLLIQPLNRVARTRLQHNAEMLCDDWAVHLTGRRLSLASCLTEVAQWVVGQPQALPAAGLVPAASMAGAPLTQRVERLLASPPREVARGERWWLALALGALGAVAGAAPGFAATLRRAPEPPPLPAPEPAVDRAAAPAGARARAAEGRLAPAAPTLERAPEPGPRVERAPASGADGAITAALEALDGELALALRELRELKREVAAAGAVEHYADRLTALEDSVATLLRQRKSIHTLLPRVLASLETAPRSAQSPPTVIPSR